MEIFPNFGNNGKKSAQKLSKNMSGMFFYFKAKERYFGAVHTYESWIFMRNSITENPLRGNTLIRSRTRGRRLQA